MISDSSVGGRGGAVLPLLSGLLAAGHLVGEVAVAILLVKHQSRSAILTEINNEKNPANRSRPRVIERLLQFRFKLPRLKHSEKYSEQQKS